MIHSFIQGCKLFEYLKVKDIREARCCVRLREVARGDNSRK